MLETLSSTGEVLTLEDALAYLRVPDHDHDTEVQDAINEAVDYCERHAQRTLRTSVQRRLALACWPKSNKIRFDYPPLITVDKVEIWIDGATAYATVATTNYRTVASTNSASFLEFDADYVQQTLESRSDALRIEYTSGCSTTTLPQIAKSAIKSTTRAIYDEDRDPKTWDVIHMLLDKIYWGQYG